MRQPLAHAGGDVLDFVQLENDVMHADRVNHLAW